VLNLQRLHSAHSQEWLCYWTFSATCEAYATGFTVWIAFVTLLFMAQLRKASPRSQPHDQTLAITSRDNRWLKRFRSTLAGDGNDEGLVGVEGVRMVEAALGSRLMVHALLVSDSGERHLRRLAPLLSPEVRVLRTSDRLFEGIADTKTPQGVAALVRPEPATFENILRGTPLVIVLAGVQDPGNVGTILRAAEAFGATGAVACSGGAMGAADPFGPKALRASAGSALRLPILRGISAEDLLAKLRSSGLKIYAAVAPASPPRGSAPHSVLPWEIDWKTPSALLIGNEGAGLPEEIARSADARIAIPQATSTTPLGIESLNAAMAATVLLYEAMRQRI
jgi:TrmH family RNA methyltransferase